MVDWIMYEKIQEKKRDGLNKSQTSRHLGVDYKTVLKYWDMTPDDYAATKECSESRVKKAEYSCAVTPRVRKTGNRLSGFAGTAYASLLA